VECFHISHYAFDGELLGSSEMKRAGLSEKWLGVTSDFLATGPIFSCKLSGTLEGYTVECTAGICQFRVRGNLAFSGALLVSGAEEQNQQLLEVFCRSLERAPLVTGAGSNSRDLLKALRETDQRPAFLVVNWLNPDISQQDQEAMFQLAYHFAGSYFQWRDDA
jgi:hypothetical protein